MLLWSTLPDLSSLVVHLELVEDLFFLLLAHVQCLFAILCILSRRWLETCCEIISFFSAEGNLTSKFFLDQFYRFPARNKIFGQGFEK